MKIIISVYTLVVAAAPYHAYMSAVQIRTAHLSNGTASSIPTCSPNPSIRQSINQSITPDGTVSILSLFALLFYACDQAGNGAAGSNEDDRDGMPRS